MQHLWRSCAAVGPQASIPDFDPWDGGVHAQVLFLLEAPGSKAVDSGFVSRNNPDETAKNFFELNRDCGYSERTHGHLECCSMVHRRWGAHSGSQEPRAKRQDVTTGTSSLERLLTLLPAFSGSGR